MQISKISAQSFGCNQCKTNFDNENCQKTPSKAVAISRNALIAALTGVLASCQSCNDEYYIGTTPEGLPIIFNQDGDSIDFVPKSIEDEYKVKAGK